MEQEIELKFKNYSISARVILLLLERIKPDTDIMSPEIQLWGEIKMQESIKNK